MKTYPNMKDTPESWLQKIPSNWNTRPLKYIFNIKKDIANETGLPVLSVTQKGIMPKNMSEKGQFAADYSKYQLVHMGDFVMNHMDLLTGWIDISQYDGVTSPDYRVFVNSNPDIYISEYYKYLFQYCYLNRIFYGLGQGVSGYGRWRLPANMFLNFILPVPSTEEQISIASFLSDQCNQIDSIIENTKASIEEYKNLRKSIVYNAITKGIDPSAKLKDSGIEWIGKIPTHWEIKKIKNEFDIYTGATPRSDKPEYWDGNITWITPADYKTEDKFIYEGRKTLTELGYRSCGTTIVPSGSIIFSKRAPVGTVAISQTPLCTSQGCLSCVPYESSNSEFFYYSMSSFTEQFELFSSGTTFKEISSTAFSNFTLPCPNISEQHRIAQFLNAKCSIIESMKAEKQKIIEELESYKCSLIYEAITGKRKVV